MPTRLEVATAIRALATLVLRAQEHPLTTTERSGLRNAIAIALEGLDDSDLYHWRIEVLNDWLIASGLLTDPPQTVTNTDVIVAECAAIQNTLAGRV